jgi:hypothetical protein
MYVGSYTNENKAGNPWDADAVRLLEAEARWSPAPANKPAPPELDTLPKAIIDAGCHDPLIYYFYYCRLRKTGQRGADGELDGPGEIWLRKALDGFRQSGYPKYFTMNAALSVALLEKRHEQPGRTGESQRLVSEAFEAMIAAIANKDYVSGQVPVRDKFWHDLQYLRDLARQTGFDTVEGLQRIVDRVGNDLDMGMLDVIDSVASYERVTDHREWELLERRVRKLLRTEEYDELEAMAARLREKKMRFSDGEWQSVRFYDALVLPRRSPPEDWMGRFAQVNRWVEARSNSAVARLALARTWEEYAWNARGGGYAKDVTPMGQALFEQRLQRARGILEGINEPMRSDPEWYRHMLLVLAPKGETWDSEECRRCLRQGVALATDYDWFDKLKAWYLLPRWYGTGNERVQVAEAGAMRMEREDGEML